MNIFREHSELYRLTDPDIIPSNNTLSFDTAYFVNGKSLEQKMFLLNSNHLMNLKNKILIEKENRINLICWSNRPYLMISYMFFDMKEYLTTIFDFYPFI